ncbi:myoneurin-like [Culicoides brevitarsis]|uniref:myoneurin-like n=1 Tax=Culicoides brevitarsis TaxID=469753 RepID=UPI00307BDA27
MDAYLDTFRIWDQESNIKELHTSEQVQCNICSEDKFESMDESSSSFLQGALSSSSLSLSPPSPTPATQQTQHQQQQPQNRQQQQLDHHATINQATMEVTSSPESDTVEIQVETSTVVASPGDDDDCETMVLDGNGSNNSNLINDNDTGSTTEYVEILEDYTEPMFPETNIEVETSGVVTDDANASATAATLQTIITEAAHSSSEPDKSSSSSSATSNSSSTSLASAPPSQTQPQIYYIYNSSKSQTQNNANNAATPTTTATIKQVIESNASTTIVQKKNDDEGPAVADETKQPQSETKLFMCGVCKIILEKRYLANHMKKHLQQVNETHTCRICKDTFSRKMLLSVHISQKHSIFTKDYVCQICKLPYDENNNDLHGGCHWFCNICSKTFMTKASMVCHSRMRHNRNQGKFVCEFCGKHYWDKATLEYHARVHVGEEKVVPSTNNTNNGTNNGASTSNGGNTGIQQDGQNNAPVLFLLQL